MFWAFILVAALAIVLIKLGTLSVWVSVFAFGLKTAILLIGILSTVLIWRGVFRPKSH